MTTNATTTTTRTKVLLVDDHDLIRHGLGAQRVHRRGSRGGDETPTGAAGSAAVATGGTSAAAARRRDERRRDRQATVRVGVDGQNSHLEALREAGCRQPRTGADDRATAGTARSAGRSQVLGRP